MVHHLICARRATATPRGRESLLGTMVVVLIYALMLPAQSSFAAHLYARGRWGADKPMSVRKWKPDRHEGQFDHVERDISALLLVQWLI